MEEDTNVHSLPACNSTLSGGLVLKKPKVDGDSKFKVPKQSILGLDKLAAQRRKERENAQRRISFEDMEHDDTEASVTPVQNNDKREFAFKKPDSESFDKANGRRNLRESKDETPSHTGGVSKMARERLRQHIKRDRQKGGVHFSSSSSTYRRDREHRNKRRSHSENERRGEKSTSRSRDEPGTPTIVNISGSTWDEDEGERLANERKSSWDYPTPKSYRDRDDWSTHSNRSSGYNSDDRCRDRRSSQRRADTDTPRPTPAHRYNSWANERKRSGATPATSRSTRQPWGDSEEERAMWEEEQRRLDREWYNIDEGYDEQNNPFTGENAEYFK